MQLFECSRSGISIEVNLENRTLVEQCDILKESVLAVKKRQVEMGCFIDSRLLCVEFWIR